MKGHRCVYCGHRRLFHWRPYWHPFSLHHWRDSVPDDADGAAILNALASVWTRKAGS